MNTFDPKIWILAARPKTLLASFAPVLVGTSMAYEANSFHAMAAFFTLLAAMLIQIGTNYANDYCDFAKGADTQERKGPLRVTQAGLVSEAAIRNAIIIAFLLAVVCGVYLVFRGGWPIMLIGIVSVILGVKYTAGRYSLAYIGIADLFVLLFFGPIAVAGTYYLQTLEVNSLVFLAGIPCGLLSVSILAVNNLRDVEEDRKAAKKTLAVRFGESFVKKQYVFCMLLATLFPLLIFILADGREYALIGVLLIPLSLSACKSVLSYNEPEELNRMLGFSALILLLYSVVFAVAWNI